MVLIFLFLFFLSIAFICTVIPYFLLYAMIRWIFSSFSLLDSFPWAPWVLTLFVFLVALITTIRKRIPDITNLNWDSGTIEDAPSRRSIPGYGGRMWNVNPIGFQSMGSMASLCAALLCFGPSLAMTSILMVLEDVQKRKRETARAQPENQELPPR